NLKPRFKRRGRIYNSAIVVCRSPFQFITAKLGLLWLPVFKEFKQLSPKTGLREIVMSDGMEKNHLVAGAAGRNIKAPLVRRLCKRTDSFVAGRDKRQEHNIAFVA